MYVASLFENFSIFNFYWFKENRIIDKSIDVDSTNSWPIISSNQNQDRRERRAIELFCPSGRGLPGTWKLISFSISNVHPTNILCPGPNLSSSTTDSIVICWTHWSTMNLINTVTWPFNYSHSQFIGIAAYWRASPQRISTHSRITNHRYSWQANFQSLIQIHHFHPKHFN